MGAGPPKAVAADADAVAQRLAIAEDQVKPPLRCRDEDAARELGDWRGNPLAGNRSATTAAAEIIGAGAVIGYAALLHPWLHHRLLLAAEAEEVVVHCGAGGGGHGQHHQCGGKEGENPGHRVPRVKLDP